MTAPGRVLPTLSGSKRALRYSRRTSLLIENLQFGFRATVRLSPKAEVLIPVNDTQKFLERVDFSLGLITVPTQVLS